MKNKAINKELPEISESSFLFSGKKCPKNIIIA
jgi:hypothetical protein